MTEFQEAPPPKPSPSGDARPAGPQVPPPVPPAVPSPAAPSPAAPVAGHPMSNPDAGVTPLPFGAPPPDLREAVIDVLQTCYDPEIPVNIYDLGLIYAVDVSPEQVVSIQMTLTSPACPVAGTLPPEVQQKVAAIPGVRAANVDLVWEPPWGRHLLSEAARLQLGMDGY